MDTKPSAVRVRGLVKRYKSLIAVNGLDLDVVQGECFGLLGPNGAGTAQVIGPFAILSIGGAVLFYLAVKFFRWT